MLHAVTIWGGNPTGIEFVCVQLAGRATEGAIASAGNDERNLLVGERTGKESCPPSQETRDAVHELFRALD